MSAPRDLAARANAGVGIEEIARLIRHAHLYYARVYVALNTILTDEEIPEALDIIREIYELGADGLIIQDTGLLEMDLPPIPLIASTQMHNHTPERVAFLEDVGFSTGDSGKGTLPCTDCRHTDCKHRWNSNALYTGPCAWATADSVT